MRAMVTGTACALACGAFAMAAHASDPGSRQDDPVLEDPPNPLAVQQRPVVLHPGHVVVGVDLGGAVTLHSSYDDRIAPWGYSGFGLSWVSSADVLVSVSRWFFVGLRGGLQYGTAGNARIDRAPLALTAFDMGAVTRVTAPFSSYTRRVIWFPGLEFAFGPMNADLALRGAHQIAWIPRASAAVMLAIDSSVIGVVFRAGYQFAPWSDATNDAHLDLSGFFTTIGLEHVQ